MILDHFGLTRHPFGTTTSQKALYRSQTFQEAAKRLEFLLSIGEGIGLLTAEPGIGKSTLLEHFFQEHEGDRHTVIQCSFTSLSPFGLLAALVRRAGLRPSRFKSDMAAGLQDCFASASRTSVVVIDEAQDLPDPSLEDLRLLTGSGGPFVLLLVGQPLLRERLAQPSNASLEQRITISYTMAPFSRLETGEYIAFRLRAAGLEESIFDEKALDTLFELTRGVAREINRLAMACLIEAASRKKKFVDEKTVHNAHHDIETHS